MSPVAIALILTAAGAHATWNFLAKRVEGDVSFIWLFQFVGAIVYTPVAVVVIIWHGMPVTWIVLLLVIVTSLLHTGYFVMLNLGYRGGDLSLVYPLARGTGPMWATIAAIVLLGERPHPIALIGAALVIGGAVFLTGDPRQLLHHRSGSAVMAALFVGILIGAYTLVDKEAVSRASIPPVIFGWLLEVGIVLLLTPVGLKPSRVAAWWRFRWREAIAIAILSPLAYIMILFALSFSPVSYVAPAREISVLFGTALGTRLLQEGHTLQRLSIATAMVVGVALLAI